MLDKVRASWRSLILGYTMPILDSDLAIAKKVFDVNVFVVISAIQVFSSLLIAAQRTIVIIGSVLPYPFGGPHLRVHR